MVSTKDLRYDQDRDLLIGDSYQFENDWDYVNDIGRLTIQDADQKKIIFEVVEIMDDIEGFLYWVDLYPIKECRDASNQTLRLRVYYD